MQRLLAYLRANIIIDFPGDLDVEQVRELLANDHSPLARALLARLANDGGTQDLMLTLADCLVEVVQGALTDDVLRDQLTTYVEA